MSLGDRNAKVGNKGSKYAYELIVTNQLTNISTSVALAATEATLLQVLMALQNGQEFEQNLVMDTGDPACAGLTGCPTYLQIRIWDTVNHVFGPPRYFDANGVEFFLGGLPLYGPMVIVNPQYVLQSMLIQLTAINADLDVALSTRASEATALLQLAQLVAINADLDVALSTRASEVTQLLVRTAVEGINTKLTAVVRTPSLTRATVVGTVAAGARSVSVFNSGAANGLWLGAVIKSGEQLSYSAGAQGDTLSAFAYDGTGTELVITTVI